MINLKVFPSHSLKQRHGHQLYQLIPLVRTEIKQTLEFIYNTSFNLYNKMYNFF